MGNASRTKIHLYVDKTDKVYIVVERVDGGNRQLKTETGEECAPVYPGRIDQLKIVRTGEVIRRIVDQQTPADPSRRK